MQISERCLRRGIVAFWGLWFLIVFASNASNGLKQLHVLPATWTFDSKNYELMHGTLNNYPEALTSVLFLGVVLWEAIATILFCRAAIWMDDGSATSQQAVRTAFAVSLGLWAGFALADEALILYQIEAAHLRLFIAQLASLLYLERRCSAQVSDLAETHDRRSPLL